MGYIDGGVLILDISDKAHPKEISRLTTTRRRTTACTHTAMPLLEARPA